MSVDSAKPSERVYFASGTTDPLIVDFDFLDADDLVVSATVEGVDTTLTRGIHYTVAGSSIVPTAVRTLHWRVRRETPNGQPETFPSESYLPDQHGRAHDRRALVAQEQEREIARAVKAPRGEAAPALPGAAARAGKIWGFDMFGASTLAISAALLLELIAVGQRPEATNSSLNVLYQRLVAGTTARTVHDQIDEMQVSLKEFGAVGDGVTDDSAAFQAWIEHLGNGGLKGYAPPGDYLITNAASLVLSNPSDGAFIPGPTITGAGQGHTRFIYTGTDGPMLTIDVDSHSPFKAVQGLEIGDFTIVSGLTPLEGAATTTNSGIKLHTAYFGVIRDIHFLDLYGKGLDLEANLIDVDANNYPLVERCYFEKCKVWGADAKAAAGTNSTGFVTFRHCWFQYCGGANTAAIPPESGGSRWKGLLANFEQCGYTLNYNCHHLTPGEAGLAFGARFTGCDFENGHRFGLYVTGIQQLILDSCEYLSGQFGLTKEFITLDASTHVIRNVKLIGGRVRAGADADPTCTFLNAFGANLEPETITVDMAPTWEDFDYGTQRRYVGVRWRPQVRARNDLHVTAGNLLLSGHRDGLGYGYPMRLSHPNAKSVGGVRSETGQVITFNVPATGLSVEPTGVPNQTINIYLREKGGLPLRGELVADTEDPAIDPETGLLIMTGKPSHTYVGRWRTDGVGNWLSTGVGWLNPARVPGGDLSSWQWEWYSSTRVLRSKFATDLLTSLPTSDTDGFKAADGLA